MKTKDCELVHGMILQKKERFQLLKFFKDVRDDDLEKMKPSAEKLYLKVSKLTSVVALRET